MALTYQKHFSLLFLGFSLALYLCAGNTYADDNPPKESELVATPMRCIALRQGQVCYQDVTFRWHQAEIGNYCLVELSTLKNIECWSQVKTGEVSFDFQSDKSLTYGIHKMDKHINLSNVSISVSWVFKSSKRPKSSWKLF